MKVTIVTPFHSQTNNNHHRHRAHTASVICYRNARHRKCASIAVTNAHSHTRTRTHLYDETCRGKHNNVVSVCHEHCIACVCALNAIARRLPTKTDCVQCTTYTTFTTRKLHTQTYPPIRTNIAHALDYYDYYSDYTNYDTITTAFTACVMLLRVYVH